MLLCDSNHLQIITFGDEDGMKLHWTRKFELFSQQGCVLWGNRVIIPPSLQQKVIQQLNDSHVGVSHMKSLGRMFVWWPGLDK